MEKFGKIVCKLRKLIIIIALLLIIPSVLGMMSTRINYDILIYLPEDIETIKGENILSKDFDMGAFSIVIIDDMKIKDISKLEKKIEKMDNVSRVISIADAIGTNIPEEMLSEEIKEKAYRGNSTIMMVTFKEGISSDETMKSVEDLRELTDKQCKISGMTATVLDTRDLSSKETTVYVIIASMLCLLVLEIALDSFIVPVFILLSIGIAILYNMGTNIFLGEISYITKAISAVLQLGVTMDFAIFLYHSYIHEKKTKEKNEDAMASAISKTLVSVLGSSITTVAGFLALCSMDLTLGKDIGIVMAKGVILGVISVVTLLPSIILVCDNLIQKTKHHEILPKFTGVKNFVINHYKLIVIIFIIILPIAFIGYKNTDVYYNLDKTLPKNLQSVIANNSLKEDFGMVSTELLLIDKDLSQKELEEMLSKIEELDGIEWTLSFSKVQSKVNIPKEALPNEIQDFLENDKYQMVIINSKYEMATDELNAQVEEVNKIIKKYDEDAILAGEGPLMKDLVQVTDHDIKSVNTVSIAVIFIIMICVLKSISLPIILIIGIEFAIFINMGIPYYTNTELPFVASIVIGTIQLGATIDYAILITTKYIAERKSGRNKKDAISQALETSISSIVVSGLCFFGATVGVGIYSKIEMISSLCTLLSRGAIISMVCVITVLPSLLMIFDKLICKSTIEMRKIEN
ncbi:MAG: MMPL family transporter [Clostridia bacterium]|nr:MMPL family transporter [Clostridia bacterium]